MIKEKIDNINSAVLMKKTSLDLIAYMHVERGKQERKRIHGRPGCLFLEGKKRFLLQS